MKYARPSLPEFKALRFVRPGMDKCTVIFHRQIVQGDVELGFALHLFGLHFYVHYDLGWDQNTLNSDYRLKFSIDKNWKPRFQKINGPS